MDQEGPPPPPPREGKVSFSMVPAKLGKRRKIGFPVVEAVIPPPPPDMEEPKKKKKRLKQESSIERTSGLPHDKFKKRECNFFLVGKCKKGERCTFLHTELPKKKHVKEKVIAEAAPVLIPRTPKARAESVESTPDVNNVSQLHVDSEQLDLQTQGDSDDGHQLKVWERDRTNEGRRFYRNAKTGEATFWKPEALLATKESSEDDGGTIDQGGYEALLAAYTSQETLPPCPWEQHVADDGRMFYFNLATRASLWEKPAELTAYEEAHALQTEKEAHLQKERIRTQVSDLKNLLRERCADCSLSKADIFANLADEAVFVACPEDVRDAVVDKFCRKLKEEKENAEVLREDFLLMLEEAVACGHFPAAASQMTSIFGEDPTFKLVDTELRLSYYQQYLQMRKEQESRRVQTEAIKKKESVVYAALQQVRAMVDDESRDMSKGEHLSVEETGSLGPGVEPEDRGGKSSTELADHSADEMSTNFLRDSNPADTLHQQADEVAVGDHDEVNSDAAIFPEQPHAAVVVSDVVALNPAMQLHAVTAEPRVADVDSFQVVQVKATVDTSPVDEASSLDAAMQAYAMQAEAAVALPLEDSIDGGRGKTSGASQVRKTWRAKIAHRSTVKNPMMDAINTTPCAKADERNYADESTAFGSEEGEVGSSPPCEKECVMEGAKPIDDDFSAAALAWFQGQSHAETVPIPSNPKIEKCAASKKSEDSSTKQDQAKSKDKRKLKSRREKSLHANEKAGAEKCVLLNGEESCNPHGESIAEEEIEGNSSRKGRRRRRRKRRKKTEGSLLSFEGEDSLLNPDSPGRNGIVTGEDHSKLKNIPVQSLTTQEGENVHDERIDTMAEEENVHDERIDTTAVLANSSKRPDQCSPQDSCTDPPTQTLISGAVTRENREEQLAEESNAHAIREPRLLVYRREAGGPPPPPPREHNPSMFPPPPPPLSVKNMDAKTGESVVEGSDGSQEGALQDVLKKLPGVCERCEDMSPNIHCEDCEMYLCQTCSDEVHASGVRTRHSRRKLAPSLEETLLLLDSIRSEETSRKDNAALDGPNQTEDDCKNPDSTFEVSLSSLAKEVLVRDVKSLLSNNTQEYEAFLSLSSIDKADVCAALQEEVDSIVESMAQKEAKEAAMKLAAKAAAEEARAMAERALRQAKVDEERRAREAELASRAAIQRALDETRAKEAAHLARLQAERREEKARKKADKKALKTKFKAAKDAFLGLLKELSENGTLQPSTTWEQFRVSVASDDPRLQDMLQCDMELGKRAGEDLFLAHIHRFRSAFVAHKVKIERGLRMSGFIVFSNTTVEAFSDAVRRGGITDVPASSIRMAWTHAVKRAQVAERRLLDDAEGPPSKRPRLSKEDVI